MFLVIQKGYLHQDYHTQSSHRMRLDDINNMWVHLDQLACQEHHLDVECVVRHSYLVHHFQLVSKTKYEHIGVIKIEVKLVPDHPSQVKISKQFKHKHMKMRDDTD